jgi:quercetin dioxygenase-like cupin family protein
MPDRFTDDRGVIQDLLGKIDAVTEIRTVKGAVRGNHVHFKTTQWTYVVSGKLRVVTRAPGKLVPDYRLYGPGEMAVEAPGVAHAWQAVEDTVCLVFTRGLRSGQDYEEDTYRLSGGDMLLGPGSSWNEALCGT